MILRVRGRLQRVPNNSIFKSLLVHYANKFTILDRVAESSYNFHFFVGIIQISIKWKCDTFVMDSNVTIYHPKQENVAITTMFSPVSEHTYVCRFFLLHYPTELLSSLPYPTLPEIEKTTPHLSLVNDQRFWW